MPLPIAWRWTLQAKVYVERGHPGFLQALLVRLRRLGVAHVRVNDERHGLPDTTTWSWPYVRPVRRYAFLIDTAGRTDSELLKAMEDPVPRNIRKAERARVVVDEIRSEEDLREFTALVEETSGRIRARRVASVYPAEFFRAAFRSMVPRGQALFLLARADGEPLAGQITAGRRGPASSRRNTDRRRRSGMRCSWPATVASASSTSAVRVPPPTAPTLSSR